MKAVSLVNLTAHPVVVFDSDGGVVLRIEPAGPVARIAQIIQAEGVLDVDGALVPVSKMAYAAEIELLPAPVEGTAYVVSRVLANAVPRPDLFFPADEVRDAQGAIVGCRGLAQMVQGL